MSVKSESSRSAIRESDWLRLNARVMRLESILKKTYENESEFGGSKTRKALKARRAERLGKASGHSERFHLSLEGDASEKPMSDADYVGTWDTSLSEDEIIARIRGGH